MVGAVSVVGSSLMDSKTVCLDVSPLCGDLSLQRRQCSTVKRQKSRLDLSSSFLASSSVKALCRSSRRQRRGRNKSLVVVSELAGHYEDNFEDVKRQLLDYFTYKAVRTVMNQLYEMNPTQYRWFYDHVASNELGYGKRFVQNLVKEKQELAERVMVTRLHLYGKWIKKYDHTEMYERISDQNLELMRERLMETVVWPSDDMNSEVV